MSIPNLNMQSFDEQRTPEGSEYGGGRSYRKSDFGAKQTNKGRVESSFMLHNKFEPIKTNYSGSEFGGEMQDMHPKERKILYRISKKIYTPQELEFIRDVVLQNRKGKSKKFLSW